VEQLEQEPGFDGLSGEALLSDVQRPLARDEARVLARVGVAEHDQLAVGVGAQRVAVDRGLVQRRHRRGRVIEVRQRLEERRESQGSTGAAGEPERGEHVGCALHRRDHHHGHSALAVRLAGQSDGVEYAQQLARRSVGAASEAATLPGDRVLEQPEPLLLAGVAVAG